jgi:hypothetical protein
MNVSINPVKRHQEARTNAIMWQEKKKCRPTPLMQLHNAFNKLDNKVKIETLCQQINNAESYITQ